MDNALVGMHTISSLNKEITTIIDLEELKKRKSGSV